MKARYIVPPLIFVVLLVVLAIGLNVKKEEIPSPFIDKPAPQFSVNTLMEPLSFISNEDFKGKVTVLNIWASWCLTCLSEHPFIMELSQLPDIQVIGLNYKDESAEAKAWLKKNGNPYDTIAFDYKGDIGINYGVYGVPETFIIDKLGIIRFKKIGGLDQLALNNTLLPLIETLTSE